VQRISIKRCFLFTVGSVCLVKRFTTGSRNCHLGGKRFADDEEVETEVWKWLRFLNCGFRRTGKSMGQVYQYWRRIRRIIRVTIFPRFEYHMFYVLYPFVTHLLSLPHISGLLDVLKGRSQ
jgi:hypothetical protein